MTWAVLTGDIVESSGLSPETLDQILDDLNQVAQEASEWVHPSETQSKPSHAPYNPFARRGGDGWQIAVNKTEFSLRLALYIRARLKRIDENHATRIAVAHGKGRLPDDPKTDLNSAHGPAFRASGQLLDALPARVQLAHAAGGALNATFRLADHISQGWTQAQARSLCLILPPGAGPRRVAAEQLKITRQAVDQALNSAGYAALEDALDALEATL